MIDPGYDNMGFRSLRKALSPRRENSLRADFDWNKSSLPLPFSKYFISINMTLFQDIAWKNKVYNNIEQGLVLYLYIVLRETQVQECKGIG